MYCVNCDMFVRSQEEASAAAVQAASATSQQANSDQIGRQETPPQDAVPSSSGKQEAAASKLHSPAAGKHGSDAVLGLLMESMELLARGLKECILQGGLSGQVVESGTKAMKDIAQVYELISKLNS